MFRKILLRYKENNDKLLACVFLHKLVFNWAICWHGYVFVCAPSRNKSLQKRGFQHLERMLEIYGFETLSVFNNIAVEDQTQIKDRREIRSKILLIEENLLTNKKVILFDDVYSSFETLHTCYQLIKPHCKKVRIISLSNIRKK